MGPVGGGGNCLGLGARITELNQVHVLEVAVPSEGLSQDPHPAG